MLRVRVLDGGQAKSGGEELLDVAGPKWIDVVEPDEPTLLRLGERFGLHKLAIEDCMHLDQRPKLEEYPGHLFIVLQGFSCTVMSQSGPRKKCTSCITTSVRL
jgi:magnesium transporter